MPNGDYPQQLGQPRQPGYHGSSENTALYLRPRKAPLHGKLGRSPQLEIDFSKVRDRSILDGHRGEAPTAI